MGSIPPAFKVQRIGWGKIKQSLAEVKKQVYFHSCRDMYILFFYFKDIYLALCVYFSPFQTQFLQNWNLLHEFQDLGDFQIKRLQLLYARKIDIVLSVLRFIIARSLIYSFQCPLHYCTYINRKLGSNMLEQCMIGQSLIFCFCQYLLQQYLV